MLVRPGVAVGGGGEDESAIIEQAVGFGESRIAAVEQIKTEAQVERFALRVSFAPDRQVRAVEGEILIFKIKRPAVDFSG